ncbi:HNH/endonuclease VII fold toxin-2 domain-containing protein [Mitsuaria sp. GD03876]|uniref:HNH/endonuclease VII fold toxin-2 domain-containing protein n=1 Tax=Mitsuaria sp. GD03876 TaxID=2975399 RepID=UPI0024471D2F|nr:HNH/endonuclease VII fold toxin-2 domain-containing protein [Mitsuaria sp. GD03876]MDH0868135.1 hypothetical protein [Mitsuaria sp. GD03876]
MANTPTTVYLDTFNTAPACFNDRTDVKNKCAKKPEEKKKEEKKRQSGLRRVIKNALSSVDEVGQKIYAYKKGSPSTNEWMDDHCDGLWVKPQFNGKKDFPKEYAEFQKRMDNLETTASYYLKNPGKIAESGYKQFVSQAMQELGPDTVMDMAKNKLGKDLLFALIPTGKGKVVQGLGQAAKGGYSINSYMDMAGEIASKIRNPATLELLDDMKFLLSERKDALMNALGNRDAMMAEALSIAAAMDPCTKARKCMLVPYDANSKLNVRKGNGCCPGQTGHHIIPNTAVEGSKCNRKEKNNAGVPVQKDYSYGSAPTICLEGQDNTYGTHGTAHGKLSKSMQGWRDKKGMDIPYTDMRNKSLEAVEHVTHHCNQECLKAQLDAYYQNCGKLKALAGSSSDPKPEKGADGDGDIG